MGVGSSYCCGGRGEGGGLGSGEPWGHLLPIPHRRHKYIISFHVRLQGWGGAGVRGQESLKIQKKLPNWISKAVGKAGKGWVGRGRQGGNRKRRCS